MKIAFASLGITLLAVAVLLLMSALGHFLFGNIGFAVAAGVWLLMCVVAVGLYIDHHK